MLDENKGIERTNRFQDDVENHIISNEDEETMKGVPIGVDNFKKIRSGDGYYVDKTGLISDIVARPMTEVFLFTRPRRFGKSLNMSMLDAFFSVDHKGNDWFDGLKVTSDKRSMEMMNSFPVVFLTLKGLRTESLEGFISDFRAKISDVCNRYTYLLKWDTESNNRTKFVDLFNSASDETGLRTSLLTLSRVLYEYHGKKTIVLIDEYDNAINNSYGKDTHKEILGFMRDLLSNVLKSNDSLQFGVVTGVMQIAKENIFSGLNNLYMNNIFSKDFDEEFGFTEREIAEMLSYYGHPEKMDVVKEWYDGYRFGDADIYNPWSILNYIQRGFETDSYWLNEGNPTIILESVKMNGPDALKIVTDLYNGMSVKAELNKSMVFAELNSMEGLLSLLVGSGYLKAIASEEGSWELKLVNKEVRDGLLKQLVTGRWKTMYMNRISKALLEGSPEDVQIELMNTLGAELDSKLTRDERYYQAFTLGLLNCLTGEYYIRSEYRGGKGYADIAIIPRNGQGPFAIIELKDELPGTDDDRMQSIADDALRQIKTLRYYSDLKGLIQMYGIATRQTDVFVAYESIKKE